MALTKARLLKNDLPVHGQRDNHFTNVVMRVSCLEVAINIRRGAKRTFSSEAP